MHTPSLLTAGASDSTNLRTVIVTAAVYRGFGSELRLATNPSPYPSGTGQASDPIPPLTSWQSPVFLVNSRLALFTATPSGSTPYWGTPSPEVTGLFCLVPSREFSRAPVDILLAHLCRFPVRSSRQLARGFSRKHGISPFVARRPPHHVSGLPCGAPTDLPIRAPYALGPALPIAGGA